MDTIVNCGQTTILPDEIVVRPLFIHHFSGRTTSLFRYINRLTTLLDERSETGRPRLETEN